MKETIIVTGCDAKFFPYMEEALASLIALNIDQRADIGIIDLGLSVGQIEFLKGRGYAVITPTWTLDIPDNSARSKHQLGLVARTALRDYFPGYRVYLWFDADAWAQSPEFFDLLVDGAKSKGASIMRENGAGYKRDLVYARWWFGNMMAAYGIITGLKVALKPAANIGILALSDTAPHWGAWIKYYKDFIQKRGKVNNQHAFNAAIELEHLPCELITARCNWITVLSAPMWDAERRMLVEPGRGMLPLSVVHLAGPDKQRIYQLKQTDKSTLATSLTYTAIRKLSGR